MKKVGAYEAKTHLSELLQEVKNGQQIMITRHGSPIAILQPVPANLTENVPDIVNEIKKFRQQHRLNGLSILQMKEEGRA